MSHGCQEFFVERERCRRRVSSICVVVGLATLAALWLPESPPFRQVLKDHPTLRFGFAGPTQYVRLVQIESNPGLSEPLIDVGEVMPARGRKGGGGEPVVSPKAARHPASQRNLPRGPGEDKANLLTRALAGHARVPIFQSNELIIEHLVRPEYPDDARERGIEGHVAVIAHVDTLGAVTEAEVMAASGEDQLDLAATSAVKLCKFRPYRVEGAAREVYAVFRFSFRIY